MRHPYGIVLGRFQPIHDGHMEYLEAARRECDRLFIGVTNPDSAAPAINEADSSRSRHENNPFSYIDRHLMIEAALLEAHWDAADFCIMAAPITQPELLASYLPPPDVARFFVTIYDQWGEQKAAELKRLGYQVTTLWRRDFSQRLTSGTWIRSAMRGGSRWQEVVPSAAVDYIEANGLDRALKELV